MAQKKFRGYSIFAGPGRKRIAEVSGSEYTIDSNDEAQIGDGEVQGYSDGVPQSRLSVNLVVPVSGFDAVDILWQARKNKEYVTITKGVVAGKILSGQYRIGSWTYRSDNAGGKVEGTIEFMGVEPTEATA